MVFKTSKNKVVVKSATTITHKIFEPNSSFLFLVLTKLSFWQRDGALGYHSMKFIQFPDISYFP